MWIDMATLSFDLSQFGIIVLMVLTFFFLYMGYGLNDRKQGGMFLIFGGIFTFSLMATLIATFSGVWWFTSPAFIIFAVIVWRDAWILLWKGKTYRRN
jgi:hypothetical protein